MPTYTHILPPHTFRAKNLEATLLFVDFSKSFDSIHRGKIEQILLAYGHPKETVAAIIMLYKNTKVKVRSLDGDTDFFDIVAGVLQGDILAPYRFIICLHYELRMSTDLKLMALLRPSNKQTIFGTNDYGRRLCWWHSATGKYTRPGWIPAA